MKKHIYCKSLFVVLLIGSIVSCSLDNESKSGYSYGSLEYYGQTYKTIKIGSQTWMAENLNYAIEGSRCYGDAEANCDKYGRLYDWVTTMNLPSDCYSITCTNQVQPKHRGICPEGWHIPSNAEWSTLYQYVDVASGASTKKEPSPYDGSYQSYTAGGYLRTTSGWNVAVKGLNGTNDFGFSALPGGCYMDSKFKYVGDEGLWWSTSENLRNYAYFRIITNFDVAVTDSHDKISLFSVRCLQD